MFARCWTALPPLCSGLARRPLKAVAPVRIRSGVPRQRRALASGNRWVQGPSAVSSCVQLCPAVSGQRPGSPSESALADDEELLHALIGRDESAAIAIWSRKMGAATGLHALTSAPEAIARLAAVTGRAHCPSSAGRWDCRGLCSHLTGAGRRGGDPQGWASPTSFSLKLERIVVRFRQGEGLLPRGTLIERHTS